MPINKGQSVRLLGALAKLVENSTQDELEGLLAGKASLRIVPMAKGNSTSLQATRPQLGEKELKALQETLLALESREAGVALLSGPSFTRKNLEILAKCFDLPIRKEDNLDRLRSRIVDTTIGARLNTRAIKGGGE